jgi:ribosome-associated translation inhibitor RaiA
MKIQINTDKTIKGNEIHQDLFITQIVKELDNYKSHIAYIEVHLSDQNGHKKGWDNIQCLLEAKLEGRQPIAVSNQANNIRSAMSGAIDKLKASFETILGRMQNHHQKIDE